MISAVLPSCIERQLSQQVCRDILHQLVIPVAAANRLAYSLLLGHVIILQEGNIAVPPQLGAAHVFVAEAAGG